MILNLLFAFTNSFHLSQSSSTEMQQFKCVLKFLFRKQIILGSYFTVCPTWTFHNVQTLRNYINTKNSNLN